IQSWKICKASKRYVRLQIEASAIRSLELLRGLRPLTVECSAAKLFAKHMKVEDQEMYAQVEPQFREELQRHHLPPLMILNFRSKISMLDWKKLNRRFDLQMGLQVSMLKSRVNIASGTPSRIKKLIDVDALGLSRLSVIVMDMHTDAEGYSLLTLPQVSEEFWDSP
ncbi:hypothetical protein IFM89_019650, partial [Coptis chinensis]